ncbi:MAG: YbaY family lipoprotein [Gammaproteobacteria bacterium]|nr:MAG: YbaY family lipoprotein [Gammaproteobacteria bacterium]
MNRFIKLALLLPFIIACGSPGGGSPVEDTGLATVSGSVTYRERIALTPEAVVEVQLLDVSLADVSAKMIAQQTIKPKHQVPIPFELVYDPADIDQRMTYAVRATIRERGRLMFTTDRHYPVLTRGHSNHVDLILVRTSN